MGGGDGGIETVREMEMNGMGWWKEKNLDFHFVSSLGLRRGKRFLYQRDSSIKPSD